MKRARRRKDRAPVAADVAAGNEEASQAVKAGTASPATDDHIRAARARSDTTTPNIPDSLSKTIESPEPQIHGMVSEGAKNALYHAAYGSCTRRKGF